MSGLVSQIVQFAVGGIFVLAGATKVYPFTQDMARHNYKEFSEFARVFPTASLGYRPEALFYQQGVGVLEVALGLGLLLAPQGRVKAACCGGLLCVMVGAAHTLVSLGRTGMAAVPLSFAAALLYIWVSLPGTKQKPKDQ